MNSLLRTSRKSHIPKQSKEEFISFYRLNKGERKINLAGISNLTPGYVINRKNCPFCILICVLEGTGMVHSKEGDYIINKGDLYFEEADRSHLYGTNTNWKILWFHLDKKLGSDSPLPFIIQSRPEQVTSLYEVTHTYLRESQIEGDSTILYSLEELIMQMISRLITLPYSQDSRSRDKKTIDKLRRSINRDISRDWSVEELAKMVDITPSYLFKIISRTLETTPLGLVRSIKMNMACHLLLHSDYPLKLIAERIGYTTPYAFSKAFKKFYGRSPGSLRKPLP